MIKTYMSKVHLEFFLVDSQYLVHLEILKQKEPDLEEILMSLLVSPKLDPLNFKIPMIFS